MDVDMKPEEKAILRNELKGPNAAKYAGKSDEQIAAMFREQVDNSVDVDSLRSADIVATIDIGDVTAIQPDDRFLLSLYAAAGTVTITPQVKQFLKKAFPDNSKTDKQLTKLLKRAGTFAESLKISLPTNNDISDITVRGQ